MTAGPAAQRYDLFGLILSSEIALPELPISNRAGAADLAVRTGAVGGEDGLGDRGYTFRVPAVAAYRVEGGSSIVIDPATGADESHVRLFLLGTAMGIAIHQRGMLPLHANGIEIEGRAVLFMGASGAGKSTLASWFVRSGYRLLADDVCAITTVNERPLVLPGIPRFRLWEDAIRSQGLTLDGLSLSYSGDPTYRKFDVPVAPPQRVSDVLPLGAIYLLHRSNAVSIEPLIGLRAIEELYAHTYRGEYVERLGTPERHLRLCSVLANQVPIHAAHRLWGQSNMGRGNALLLDHAVRAIQELDAVKSR